jgi:uncharacterized Zn finger protein
MDCGDVHNIELRPPKAVSITATLSDGNLSTSDIIEVDEDEVISVGDLFEHDEAQWEVTRIDGAASQPFDSLPAGDIRALWAVRKDKAVVRLTMTDGEDSVASSIECEPDRVFTCGTILEIDGRRGESGPCTPAKAGPSGEAGRHRSSEGCTSTFQISAGTRSLTCGWTKASSGP